MQCAHKENSNTVTTWLRFALCFSAKSPIFLSLSSSSVICSFLKPQNLLKMPSTVLPPKIALPAVALSAVSTLIVSHCLDSANKPGLITIIEATGAYVIMMSLVGSTARFLLGSNELVTVTEQDDGNDNTESNIKGLGQSLLARDCRVTKYKPDTLTESSFIIFPRDTTSRVDDHLPEPSEKRGRSKTRKRQKSNKGKPRIQWTSPASRLARRISLMQKRNADVKEGDGGVAEILTGSERHTEEDDLDDDSDLVPQYWTDLVEETSR